MKVEMRKGRFQVSYELRREIEVMRAIQDDMVVLHVDSNPCTNRLTFFGVHPAFDPLSEFAEIPFYEPVIESVDGRFVAQWRRLGYDEPKEVLKLRSNMPSWLVSPQWMSGPYT